MSVKSLIVIFGLSALAISPAVAQDTQPRPFDGQAGSTHSRGRPPLIEIHPGTRLLYRRCTDWYELQDRPSGTVLFPGKRCWWVRG